MPASWNPLRLLFPELERATPNNGGTPYLSRPFVGYNFLGPGNYGYGWQPTNPLDAMARTHDIRYDLPEYQHRGGISMAFFEADPRIVAADLDLAMGATRRLWELDTPPVERLVAAETAASFTLLTAFKTALGLAGDVGVLAATGSVPRQTRVGFAVMPQNQAHLERLQAERARQNEAAAFRVFYAGDDAEIFSGTLDERLQRGERALRLARLHLDTARRAHASTGEQSRAWDRYIAALTEQGRIEGQVIARAEERRALPTEPSLGDVPFPEPGRPLPGTYEDFELARREAEFESWDAQLRRDIEARAEEARLRSPEAAALRAVEQAVDVVNRIAESPYPVGRGSRRFAHPEPTVDVPRISTRRR